LKKAVLILLAIILITGMIIPGCNLFKPGTGLSDIPGSGVLNLSGIDPNTLDPAVASETTSAEFIMQIFSGLIRLDDNLDLAPDIAERWVVSPDGRTYTFYLREDVKFHNGKQVKAQDFKNSWERAANPAIFSQTAATYLGDIVGIQDVLEGRSQEASGIKVVDNYILEVTIDSPKSYFLFKLTYPATFVVDMENTVSGRNWWHKPNGTGPFKLQEWKENTSLTLVNNETYYGEKARVQQVVYQFYSGLPMDLYETGKIDVTGVSMSYIDKVTDQSGPFYQELDISPALSFYYIGFNCSEPPFDDADIRRAFSLAIDKDKIVSLVYRDMVEKADGIIPPGLPGYNENLSGLDYDVEKALDLIKASRYGEVSQIPPITLTTAGYGGAVGSTLEALVYQWKENLGIDVQIRQLEPERYFYNLKEEKDQMYSIGWSADYPHPQNFLDVLFSTDSNYNYGGYSNPDVDDLIYRAGRELNLEQSFVLYQKAEQKIVADAVCIPLTFDKNYLLTKPYVEGYLINPLGFAELNRVSITSR